MSSSYDAKSSDSVAGLVWCPRTYRYPRRKWAGLGEVLVVMVVVVVIVVVQIVVVGGGGSGSSGSSSSSSS